MSFFNEKINVTFEDMLMAFSQALNLVDARLTGISPGQLSVIVKNCMN